MPVVAVKMGNTKLHLTHYPLPALTIHQLEVNCIIYHHFKLWSVSPHIKKVLVLIWPAMVFVFAPIGSLWVLQFPPAHYSKLPLFLFVCVSPVCYGVLSLLPNEQGPVFCNPAIHVKHAQKMGGWCRVTVLVTNSLMAL